jgi:hypothetical protein
MRILRNFLSLCVAAAVSMPVAASAQPSMTDTQGWLDSRGKTDSDNGGALAGASVGPYRAGFSNVSMTAARASTEFDVFCIDWLSGLYDSKVNVLTLGAASTNAGLLAKFATPANNGVTLAKLQQAAWLTQQFDGNGMNWKNVHQAIWSLFVPVGGGNPAFPALTAGATNYVASAEAAVLGGFTGEQFRVMLAVDDQGVFNPNNQVVIVELPEPANVLLLGTALFSLVFFARRKSQGQA